MQLCSIYKKQELNDQYIYLRNTFQAQKQYYHHQIINIQKICQIKIKDIERQLEKHYQEKIIKINKGLDQLKIQHQKTINQYQSQINQINQNSRQLAHELKYAQDQYRQSLLRNETLIQQTINRQLRKRDFEAQNNHLRDLSQYESVKKQRNQLQDRLFELQSLLNIANQQIQLLKPKLQASTTRCQNLEKALKYQQENNKINIEKQENNHIDLEKIQIQKSISNAEIQINTQHPYIPIMMPVDTDFMAEIVNLKQFVVQKIIQKFIDFYLKTSTTDSKRISSSFMAFKNSILELKKSNPDNKLLFFFHSSLDRIIKIYCPAMSYSRQFLTTKDQFIRKVLIDCQSLTNEIQKLYRLLQLIHRLKYPITHIHTEVSTAELRLVQNKVLGCLKKIFK